MFRFCHHSVLMRILSENPNYYQFFKKYAGDRIRTCVSTKLQDLKSCPFDHSGTPACNLQSINPFKKLFKSLWRDLNPRLLAYEASALPTELHRQ